MVGSATPGYQTAMCLKEVVASMEQTHHCNVKHLECLRFDRTKKAVEEYSMEKCAQDLTSVLAIKSLIRGLLETSSKRIQLTMSIVTVACVLFMAW